MAVKNSQRGANNGETGSEAQLAPPAGKKERAPLTQSQMDDGTLDVDTGDLKLPQDLTEEETKKSGLLSVDPAVMFILCCSLIFIAVIAFVIWNGWEPPR